MNVTTKCTFIQEYVIYAVQYSIVALMGLRFVNRKKSGRIIAIISFLTLVICIIVTGLFEPSAFKYPPQTYYISYGLLCSVIIYKVVNHLQKYIFIEKQGVIWLSTHSFSIYICHIYYLWMFFLLGKLGIRVNYIFEFVILIITSVGQTMILEKLKARKKYVFN